MHSSSGDADRLVTLDAIRGVAVIGILAMNIVSFALPSAAAWNPLAGGGSDTVNLFVYLAGFVFIDGKMRGLFSLLFGASMVLMIDRARAAGHDGKALQRRRLAVLAVVGLAHYYLLWHGDILFLYAAVGFLLIWFIDRSGERLVNASLMAFITAFIIQAIMAVGMLAVSGMADLDPDQYGSDYAALLSALSGDGEAALAEQAAVTGSYQAAVAWRWSPAMRTVPFDSLLLNGIETLALMLAGAGLQRSGFFRAAWPQETYYRVVKRYGLISIVGLTLLAAWMALKGFPLVLAYTILYSWSQPLDWLLCIAYAAGLVMLISTAPACWLTQRLAAAGRVALSNYILTTVVMTTLFYGYGLGWFGALGRLELYAVVAAGAVLMLAWPPLWLARFRQGPLEGLWRRLARASR